MYQKKKKGIQTDKNKLNLQCLLQYPIFFSPIRDADWQFAIFNAQTLL